MKSRERTREAMVVSSSDDSDEESEANNVNSRPSVRDRLRREHSKLEGQSPAPPFPYILPQSLNSPSTPSRIA